MNYYATGRTNYFPVKDEDAFRAGAEAAGLTVVARDRPGQTTIMFGLLSDESWPSSLGPEGDDEFDITDFVSDHIDDDAVGIIMESGCEGHRYLTGWAVAVNSDGDVVAVGLDDIYEQAKELGTVLTRAEY